MSFTFHNINIAKISTNLKYYDNHCCNSKIKEKIGSHLGDGIAHKRGSKINLQFVCIMTLRMEVLMSSFCSFNTTCTFKSLSPNFFSKWYCIFNKVTCASYVFFCIKVQSIFEIDDPINIHELLIWKPPSKLFDEANNYNWTLHFHFLNNRPIITSAHSQDTSWGPLVMDSVSLTLEVKISILNVSGCINPSS